MKSLLLLLCLLPISLRSTAPAATVVPSIRVEKDGAGRILTLPSSPARVYATSPVAIMMLYALAPEKMIGWNYQLGEREARYILPAQRKLPTLGGWFGENGKGNRETLLNAQPDLILSIGYNDKTSVEFADRLQNQVNIPVAVASGSLKDTPETLELLGRLLHCEDRAAELSSYARRSLAEAERLKTKIAKTPALRVYYAEGMRGLQTDTSGSMHTEVLDFLGIRNVAEGAATSGFGRIAVSLEQVITWAPEVLLICPEKGTANKGWVPEWLSATEWKRVRAVEQDAVYLIPGEPFNWFDRPPSAARLLGLKWLVWRLYPELANYDMVDETRTFYRLFYHYDMDAQEARELLAASKVVVGKTTN